jgi:acyl dehydratase
MAIDLGAVGVQSTRYTQPYDWKTLALYALGIGAKHDELDYLYEARGPKVFPTFGVVPAYPVLMELIGKSGGRLDRLVHSAQSVRAHAPLPASGELSTSGTITGIYDLKRMAQLVFNAQTSVEGTLVFESEWTMLFLGEGGFEGPRPPKSNVPRMPGDTAPTDVFEETVAREQALLYRLNGDPNPLHVDPAFAAQVGFPQGPILHGLATYGFCARALIKTVLGGDAARLAAFHGHFRKPVWPGELLRTEIFEVEGQYVLRALAGGREEPVGLFAAETRAAQ